MLRAQYVTLTGTLAAANGVPAKNYSIGFTPTQFFYIAGTTVIITTSVGCATSVDGSVVKILNPRSAPIGAVTFSGTLPAANYFVMIAFYDGAGHVTLTSPEITLPLGVTGQLQISPPVSGVPSTASGMNVYIGTSSGSETLQGQTTGSATFVQSIPLVAGASLPAANTTVCNIVANDAGWPSFTGYNVSLLSPAGQTVPGYPMVWRLLGAGSTINLSNGLPYYNGQVLYPTPILSQPINHNLQSIAGPLDLTSYNLTSVGRLGVGTSLPVWGVDAEGVGTNGAINAATGFLFNGFAAANHVLLGNGSYYVDSASIPYSIISGAPTLRYQTVAVNSVNLAQEPLLNFSSNFAGADNPTVASNIDLSNTGVSAGACASPTSITFDLKGRASGCTPGAANRILAIATGTSCALAGADANGGWSCNATFSWGSTLPDATYKVFCTETYPTAGGAYPGGTFGPSGAAPVTLDLLSGTKTTTGFQYMMAGHQSGNNGAVFALECMAAE